LQQKTGGFSWAIDLVTDALDHLSELSHIPANVHNASASHLPFTDSFFDCITTDPPYYSAVPYSDLSDFFYVWPKRNLGDMYRSVFRSPLTPKSLEIVSHLGNNYPGQKKTADDYEKGMFTAFSEMKRTLRDTGVCSVMFAHKTTTAWENLINALVRAGFSVTTSWPIHTEGRGRLRAHNSAALAGSITLVCRPRAMASSTGYWDDVRKELKEVARERLDFFWSQGIRGADFFISAIGPALSVFGKYERVTKLSGDEVSVGQFLDEVRSLVTAYALSKIMKTTHTASIDPDSQFYVIWKWSYGEAKVPADESFKLAQALGMDTETMWDRTGVLEKAGENVLAVPVAKRMKIKNLGEPNADTTPASLIDVLHRLCVFREKGDNEGMAEFLGRSGQGRNTNLWLVAQAISEILPDGDKEKRLMQGLLNQRDMLEEAAREKKLF
jgi:putative DNA methylase